MNYDLMALSPFGIESIVGRELEGLGFKNLKKENGRVEFKSDANGIVKSNIFLRTAERIVIRMGEFYAKDFNQLFLGVQAIPWEGIIPENGKIYVTGKSRGSVLTHVPSCQSIVKKAIIKAMQRKYKKDIFIENGPLYRVEVSLNKNRAMITLDTTGPGLHRRGYRLEAGEAPMKESLAAALVCLSRWRPPMPLIDPFCGSGTIVIEAALISANIAPGIKRTFVSESWPGMKEAWKIKKLKLSSGLNRESISIMGSDIDKRMVDIAKKNAQRAGVADLIRWKVSSFEEMELPEEACIITNPPYGDRTGEKEKIKELYRLMGKRYSSTKKQAFHIFSGYPFLEKMFEKKANKNRKLYNGRIKCYFYEYFPKK